MPALPALLVGGGLLILAAVVMIYRESLTAPRVFAIVLLAIVTSGIWEAYEHRLRMTREVNVTHVGANTFVHLGLISLLMAILFRPRRPPEHHTMRGSMVIFRVFLGIMFLILGVIGGFIPILQGWIFILLGLLVLFPRAKFTEKVLHKAEPKLPRVVRFLRRVGIGTQE